MPVHSVYQSIHPRHPMQQQQLIKPTDTKKRKKKCCMEKLHSKPVYFQVSQVLKAPFTTCHIPLWERGAIWDATCSSGSVTAHVLYLQDLFVVCHKVTLTHWLQKSGIQMLGLAPLDQGCPHVSSIWSQEIQETHFSYITPSYSNPPQG